MTLTLHARIAICCAALALSACTSTPPQESAIWEVTLPANLTANASLNASNSGYIQITRDSGEAGSACATNIVVGGRAISRLRSAERATVRVPVGETKVTAQIVGVCPGSPAEMKVLVTADATTRLRIRYGNMPGDFALIRIND